jgi:hypothetical protein
MDHERDHDLDPELREPSGGCRERRAAEDCGGFDRIRATRATGRRR